MYKLFVGFKRALASISDLDHPWILFQILDLINKSKKNSLGLESQSIIVSDPYWSQYGSEMGSNFQIQILIQSKTSIWIRIQSFF